MLWTTVMLVVSFGLSGLLLFEAGRLWRRSDTPPRPAPTPVTPSRPQSRPVPPTQRRRCWANPDGLPPAELITGYLAGVQPQPSAFRAPWKPKPQ